METKILLACDLARTVLPEGDHALSRGAVSVFKEFVIQKNVILAYFSGKNLEFIQDALHTYAIPFPDIAVGDEGTTMYFRQDHNSQFKRHLGWEKIIAQDWNGKNGADIHQLIKHLPGLKVQEPEKQNTFKQSYYLPLSVDHKIIAAQIKQILREHDLQAAVIYCVHPKKKIGLLDIIPKNATKKHALRYLQAHLKIDFQNVIYAGDSGNDIKPLTSGYKTIVVHNASSAVKKEVRQIAKFKQILSQVYFAKGGFRDMNGNYVSGILEGLEHFGFIKF